MSELQIAHDYSANHSERYRETLLTFLDALKQGNSELAHASLQDFLDTSNFLGSEDLNECRKNLMQLNGYCQIAFFSTNIHPSHILKLYSSLQEKIENTDDREFINNIPKDICHKYCLLVRNYAFSQYSKTIRAVINYINLHLEEDLTLAFLAEHFQKNATSLSSSFSKEVGTNVTNYIHQTRIREAIRYFNTTKMSISEVAQAVGFQDLAYFSRLFHKQIGCSPRDYCRSINR